MMEKKMMRPSTAVAVAVGSAAHESPSEHPAQFVVVAAVQRGVVVAVAVREERT